MELLPPGTASRSTTEWVLIVTLMCGRGIEVVLHVLVELADGRQVARSCSLVCQQWAGLSREPALWKALVHRFLGAAPTPPQVSSIFCCFYFLVSWLRSLFIFLCLRQAPAGGRWKEAYFGLTRRLTVTLKIVRHLNSPSRAVVDVLQEQSALDSSPLARPQYEHAR